MVKKSLLFTMMIGASLVASAQKKVEGNVDTNVGWGNTDALNVDFNLKFENRKFCIKPFFNMTGITDYTSGEKENIDYIYSRTGKRYSSSLDTKSRGTKFALGVDFTAKFTNNNSLSFYLKGKASDIESRGTRTETLYDSNGDVLSGVHSTLKYPVRKDSDIDLGVSFTHRFDDKGFITIKYDGAFESADEDMKQIVNEAQNFTLFKQNDLASDVFTSNNALTLDWKYRLAEGHHINAGTHVKNRIMDADDEQRFDGEAVVEESYSHLMAELGAHVGYELNVGAVSATARVEYDHTFMRNVFDGEYAPTRHFNDIVPMARIMWRVDASNTLTAQYGRRIIRPGIELLNPARIRGAYTLDYGNPDLVGTHANNVSLAYNLKKKEVDFTATLAHIFAEDGFNALWMMDGDVRIYTWGNQGVRRAWSLTPEVKWTPSDATTLTAKSTILWDKRIAYAINMEHPHWGFTVQAGIRQKLPCDFLFGARALYSEGNTIDLYSYAGDMFQLGADIQRSFLPKKNLTVTLAYNYNSYAKTIITQTPMDAYTGSVFNRPTNRNMVLLGVGYKF